MFVDKGESGRVNSSLAVVRSQSKIGRCFFLNISTGRCLGVML